MKCGFLLKFPKLSAYHFVTTLYGLSLKLILLFLERFFDTKCMQMQPLQV